MGMAVGTATAIASVPEAIMVSTHGIVRSAVVMVVVFMALALASAVLAFGIARVVERASLGAGA
jgi:hypothetical protein